MIANSIFIVTLLSALGSGLIAGVFFAFSAFVMKALARLPPAQGIAAMQSINVVVLNRWFFAAFLRNCRGLYPAGYCVALDVARTWCDAPADRQRALSHRHTIACNVPQNDALAAVDPASAEGACGTATSRTGRSGITCARPHPWPQRRCSRSHCVADDT
jgi:uncharacterized membrane protein